MTTPRTYIKQMFSLDMITSMKDTGLPAGQLVVGSSAPSTAATTFTLSANAPAWVIAGMPVWDVTGNALLGHVASVSNATVTLAANSAANGSVGDIVQFGFTPSDLAVGAAAGYDVRGVVEVAWQKLNEAYHVLNDLVTNVITNSQDAQANTQLAAARDAL